MIILYITCKDNEQAKTIAKHLIEKKLIACANTFPINSIYTWKDKLCEENETVLLAKTTEEKHKIVEEEIKQIHSYEIPCILKLKAEANKEFDDWLNKQIN